MEARRLTIYIIDTISKKRIATKRIINNDKAQERIQKLKSFYIKQPNIVLKISS
ncbi:hypothetical protein [Veillonella sp.]|uniref:hypothetical protein n=1 Tax=Veillonella sp. TaxID=1926307 RepID=UPI002908A1FA|nr:hypothetical protein [Veillonella sp.]MDU3564513.1 hypothetical protein [Veillonella sp.]MDU3630026.1 hypothetical protein [Veillonella sp.]